MPNPNQSTDRLDRPAQPSKAPSALPKQTELPDTRLPQVPPGSETPDSRSTRQSWSERTVKAVRDFFFNTFEFERKDNGRIYVLTGVAWFLRNVIARVNPQSSQLRYAENSVERRQNLERHAEWTFKNELTSYMLAGVNLATAVIGAAACADKPVLGAVIAAGASVFGMAVGVLPVLASRYQRARIQRILDRKNQSDKN